MNDKKRDGFRYLLKDSIRQEIDFSMTDQHRGVPPPPIQKPCPDGAVKVDLPAPEAWEHVKDVDLRVSIRNRKSCRRYRGAAMRLDELSFLLWATQGIRKRVNPATALRTVPSAGARHALETYLCVLNVADLNPGVYRYLPLDHQVVFVSEVADLSGRLAEGALGQGFAGQGAVTFVWAAIPYRMEWRYGLASYKVIALDAGHVCQNLYLACQAIGAGTCAIAAYDQNAMDRLIGVDGDEEFTVYLAPVGRL